jgi:F-type H+/Na+-transporting ATPase subunit alpha
LKQAQYSPVAVERQVVVLYALTKGYMDEIPVEKIKEFEEGLVNYTENNAKKFYKEITETNMWTDAGEAELKKVIEEFKNNFLTKS